MALALAWTVEYKEEYREYRDRASLADFEKRRVNFDHKLNYLPSPGSYGSFQQAVEMPNASCTERQLDTVVRLVVRG